MARNSFLTVLSLIVLMVLGLSVCMGPTLSQGLTYYVSAGGDDTASGRSHESAWATLGRASEHRLRPGDTVVLTGDRPLRGSLILNSMDGGDPLRPVHIRADEGFPGIEAEDFAGISITDTSGVLVEGIPVTVKSSDAEQETGGVLLSATRGSGRHSAITIRESRITGANNGIALSSPTAEDGFEDVTIENVMVSDSLRNGIITHGRPAPEYGHRNIRVTGSLVSGTRGIRGLETNSGSGIVIGSVEGALVEGNEAIANGAEADAEEGPIGIWAHDATGVIIRDNVAHGNLTSYADGGGFGLDVATTDSVMERNFSHNNAGPGFLVIAHSDGGSSRGNTLRYNATVGDAWLNPYHGGISIIGGFTPDAPHIRIEDTRVHHNTVIPSAYSGAAALGLRGYLVDLRVHHNIFDSTAGHSPAVRSESINPDSRVTFRANQWAVNYPEGAPVIVWDGGVAWNVAEAEAMLPGSYWNFGDWPTYPVYQGTSEDPRELEPLSPAVIPAEVAVGDSPAGSDLLGNTVEEPNPVVGAIRPASADGSARRRRTCQRG